MNGLKNTVVAAGLLALSSGAALANPAVVTNDVHLRAGPAADYQVMGVLPQGADVRAWNCDGGWCRVTYGGQEGFASESYLDIGHARMAAPAYDEYSYRSGYRDDAYAPEYRNYAYEPSLPNPLDFPLLPWNW
jgi:uncharacterized protein YraI